VADLCAVLQLPRSTVSRHLKLLADEGWVAARPDGTSRLYRLTVDDLGAAARRLWGPAAAADRDSARRRPGRPNGDPYWRLFANTVATASHADRVDHRKRPLAAPTTSKPG
jgi:DNA-binding transcriptional ArsR family regulator